MRIGFIINSRVPTLRAMRKGMPPRAMVLGWDDPHSPMSFMRFRWIARFQPKGVYYELYRSWRSYDAVIFLKSMGPDCVELIRRLRDSGTAILFEANTDYYTRSGGPLPIKEMAPSTSQRAEAEQITKEANAVIASSRQLAQVCSRFNSHSHWVPDNILPELCPTNVSWKGLRGGKLQIWWSGMGAKLFELLAAEESLVRFKNHIHLNMVTDNFSPAAAQWQPDIQARFESFLNTVSYTFHRFDSIPDLLRLYSTGGVVISPRFLDMPYNLGHSEWKITLGMVCGLPALGSPVPSYEDVAQRADRDAIRICRQSSDWDNALEWALARQDRSSEAAVEVVRRYYFSPVVAEQHWRAVRSVLQEERSGGKCRESISLRWADFHG